MKTYTAEEVSELLDPAGREKVNVWLARGDGVAVYRNEDFGSGDLGNFKFLSFGSADAVFAGAPPEQLPDFPDEINWRFRLHGVYRSATLLTEPVAHDWVSIGKLLDMFVGNFTIDSLPEREKYPNGRMIEASMNWYESGLFHLSGTVLTSAHAQANVTLSTSSKGGQIDRLGQFAWSVTLPDGTTVNSVADNLGSAQVDLYNKSLDKEDTE